jgi:CSLREA domain-containing protein
MAHVGAAALQRLAMPGVVDQDATHGLGGRSIEMPPVLELQLAQAGQAQIRLVHQGSRLQRVFRALAAEDAIGHAPKLRVHALDQRLERGTIAGVLTATLLAFATVAQAATFTVNTTDDTNDGTCNAAHCSLREALIAAQAVGSHTIAFNIPGGGVRTIVISGTQLSSITRNLTIDGYTQPGSSPNTNATGAINAVPLVEVRCVSVDCFSVINSDVTMRGLIVNTSGDHSKITHGGGTLTVTGMFIGTDATGNAAFTTTNPGAGIAVFGGTVVVGGTNPADRNLISGNEHGISGADGTTAFLRGNLIGTNKAGTAAVPNQIGYAGAGCLGQNIIAQIGGTTPAARNVISGNTQFGIHISTGAGCGFTTNGTFVKGNYIGTDVTGTLPVPNGTGVEIGADSNVPIGGRLAGEGNIIAFNNGPGVALNGGDHRVSVLSNSMHSNGGLGIDINGTGVTANDPGDADNGTTNFPVITNIIRGGSSTNVEGTFDAAIAGEYIVQFFSNDAIDASSHGEGRTLIGELQTTVAATGSQTFNVTLNNPLGTTQFLTATVTAPDNNTSELSEAIADLTLTHTDAPDPVALSQNVTHTMTVVNTSDDFPSGAVTLTYTLHPSATFVSASGGGTFNAGVVTFNLGILAINGGSATRTVVVHYATPGTFASTATVTSPVTDPAPASNTATTSTTVNNVVVPPTTFTISGQVRDLNDTGVPDVTVTLSGSEAASVTTDADGRYAFTGVASGGTYTVTPSLSTFTFSPANETFPNLQTNQVASFFIAQVGTFTRYFAEGSTGAFFDTTFALLNATSLPVTATARFQREDGQVISQNVQLAPLTRATVNPKTIAGLDATAFSTVIASNEPIIADRTMHWDASGYGSHMETSIAKPLTRWYLAEGATTGGFNLFYLIQNPTATDANVEVVYLRPAPLAPITRTHTVNANSRFSLHVNGDDPLLDDAEIAAVITSTNDVPIIVERSMYLDSAGQLFGAGHGSAAIADLSTHWFFAEGATGPFFNLYILVANPGSTDAQIEARYLLPSGQVITKSYVATAHSRLTIGVHAEGPELANTPVSTIITSTNNVPVLAERAMWWPAAPLAAEWTEAHNSAGAVQTGEKWGLAEGEEGGPSNVQTYVLIANTSDVAGTVQVKLIFEDGTTTELDTPLTVSANSRTTLEMGATFPSATGRRFGVIVESLGTPAAQLVVERALYNDAIIRGQHVVWAAGANAMGTRLR